MRSALEDGQLQVTAGASLLENSRLVEWIPQQATFIPVQRETFDYSIRRDVDPVFGRLMCWILFSAGAEFLLKGMCLTKGIDFRVPQDVPACPTRSIETWVPEFVRNPRLHRFTTTSFGTLADIVSHNRASSSPLSRLCSMVGATAQEGDLLWAAYRLLAKTIRNRDAHAYVPNIRDSHFSLVPDLFCDCFNLLLSWLPNGPKTLNTWRADASEFIASL
jgi:hypothetical protein